MSETTTPRGAPARSPRRSAPSGGAPRWPSSSHSCDVLTGALGHADPDSPGAPVALDLLGAVADPGALLGLRVHQHHVADVDRGLDRLDATGPGAAAGLAGADMLGHPLHALDDEAVGVLEDLQDASLLAAVATRDDDDKVALLDLGHGQSTSGANEMIFMNFLSRSSRLRDKKFMKIISLAPEVL